MTFSSSPVSQHKLVFLTKIWTVNCAKLVFFQSLLMHFVLCDRC